jgi:hypothetical protein
VLCTIRPDFESRLNDCPIVRCTIDDLADRLGTVLSDTTDRAALGEAGRAYVTREHAAPVIADRLIALYRSIGARHAETRA